jgi:hypothetical protein
VHIQTVAIGARSRGTTGSWFRTPFGALRVESERLRAKS